MVRGGKRGGSASSGLRSQGRVEVAGDKIDDQEGNQHQIEAQTARKNPEISAEAVGCEFDIGKKDEESQQGRYGIIVQRFCNIPVQESRYASGIAAGGTQKMKPTVERAGRQEGNNGENGILHQEDKKSCEGEYKG